MKDRPWTQKAIRNHNTYDPTLLLLGPPDLSSPSISVSALLSSLPPTSLSLFHWVHGKKWPPKVAFKSWIALTCTDSVIYAFICSSTKYLLNTYYILGLVLDVGDTLVNKIEKDS